MSSSVPKTERFVTLHTPLNVVALPRALNNEEVIDSNKPLGRIWPWQLPYFVRSCGGPSFQFPVREIRKRFVPLRCLIL